jgi:GT2 family glycosyltransferase
MKDKNICVIIVTYNGMKWIEKCLHDVLLSDVNPNVIIIDNGSTDGTIEFIENKYPGMELIKSTANLGFGQANNVGIIKAYKAQADYVFLLNQDGYVEKDTIRKLIEFNQSHPEYGVLSPQQMNGSGTALDRKFESITLSKKCIIDSFTNSGTPVYNVYFVMAAFWLVSMECLKKVGVFDPLFFHYGEDGDYLNRVRYHGLKVGVVMDSIGYHDRHERVIPNAKKLSGYYASQLATLTNINHNYALCFAKVTYMYLKLSIQYFFGLNFDLLKVNNKGFLGLVSKTKQILATRTDNKKIARIFNKTVTTDNEPMGNNFEIA